MPIIPPTDTVYAQSLLQSAPTNEPSSIAATITHLSLQQHIEGGYFVETDRDPLQVPNPFLNMPLLTNATAKDHSTTRQASTTIFYLLTPGSPVGHFHRNRGRTVHTLHRGRGRYVLIHADRRDGNGRTQIETFAVGLDLARGERCQWIVEGGKFKASFLLPDDGGEGGKGQSENGLLISETVVPGFEFSDHDFMTAEAMVEVLATEERNELMWLLKREEQGRLEGLVKERDRK